MGTSREKLALIGFGEAGQAFGSAWQTRPHVYDIKTDNPQMRGSKLAEYERGNVLAADSLAAALNEATIIVSLVTADQALGVARKAGPLIAPGALYCDFNSVAPQTKRDAAAAIEAAGGHYIDVAVMAPVHPARLATPLLLSGPCAVDAAGQFTMLGFTNIRIAGDTIGQASAVKMIRSVMIKGLEALTAECFLGAAKAGVADEVCRSLDSSYPGIDWAERADYALDRMLIHGLRRAAEMDEVVKTLESLEHDAAMSRATANRQRTLGSLGISAPPAGLVAKADAIARKMRTGTQTT